MAALKCLLILAVVACVYGTSFYNTGSCPPNRSAGDRWTLAGSCVECYCDQTGYGCAGCVPLSPVIGCYQVVNASLPYPDCCPRLQCVTVNWRPNN